MTASSPAMRSALAGSGTWQALVVHDLKNALGTLEDRLAGLVAAPSAQAAEQAHRQCCDLRRKLVGLLLVQRGEAEGGLPAWTTDESPADLLDQLAATPPWSREDLVLHRHVAPGTPECWTFDRHLVRMALEAALHNAGRHAHGRVELSVAPERGGLRFEVRDDGPGLDAVSIHERGTGLGTALCRAVADAHRLAGRSGEVSLDGLGLRRPDDPDAAPHDPAAKATAQPDADPAALSRHWPPAPGPAPTVPVPVPDPAPRRGARFSLWLP